MCSRPSTNSGDRISPRPPRRDAVPKERDVSDESKTTPDDLRKDPHFARAAADGKLDFDGVTEVLAAGKRVRESENAHGVTAAALVRLDDHRCALIKYMAGVGYGTEEGMREIMDDDDRADCLAGLADKGEG